MKAVENKNIASTERNVEDEPFPVKCALISELHDNEQHCHDLFHCTNYLPSPTGF